MGNTLFSFEDFGFEMSDLRSALEQVCGKAEANSAIDLGDGEVPTVVYTRSHWAACVLGLSHGCSARSEGRIWYPSTGYWASIGDAWKGVLRRRAARERENAAWEARRGCLRDRLQAAIKDGAWCGVGSSGFFISKDEELDDASLLARSRRKVYKVKDVLAAQRMSA